MSSRRRMVRGYTVDDRACVVAESGLSVERTGDGWTVQFSIVDVPFAVKGPSELEQLLVETQSAAGGLTHRPVSGALVARGLNLATAIPVPTVTVSSTVANSGLCGPLKVERTDFANEGSLTGVGLLRCFRLWPARRCLPIFC